MRATSSTMTAALTASLAFAPIVNGPWFRISTARLRWPVSVSTMPRPIESSPMIANGPTGIGAAELVGHRRDHARDLLAARRPGGRVGGVRVHDTADVGHVPVDVGVRRGVARRRPIGSGRALDDIAVEVAEDHVLGCEVVVGDAATA